MSIPRTALAPGTRPRPAPARSHRRPALSAAPRPITRLNATAVAAREITLEWDQPAGDYTDFEVQYLTEDNRLQTHTTDELTITVLALKPYTNYTFTVRVSSRREP